MARTVWRNELRQLSIRRSKQRIRALASRWLSNKLNSSTTLPCAFCCPYKRALHYSQVTLPLRVFTTSAQSVLGTSARVLHYCVFQPTALQSVLSSFTLVTGHWSRTTPRHSRLLNASSSISRPLQRLITLHHTHILAVSRRRAPSFQ